MLQAIACRAMRAEVWALLGVVVGAVLSGVVQLIHSGVQRRWAKQDAQAIREREQDARLFDHRRIAYVEFAEQIRNDEDAAFAWVYDLPGSTPPDDYDAFELYGPLTAAAERVGIFGSRQAHEVAQKATRAMLAYGMSGHMASDPLHESRKRTLAMERELKDLIEQFRTVVRADLAVDRQDVAPAS